MSKQYGKPLFCTNVRRGSWLVDQSDSRNIRLYLIAYRGDGIVCYTWSNCEQAHWSSHVVIKVTHVDDYLTEGDLKQLIYSKSIPHLRLLTNTEAAEILASFPTV